MSNGEGQENPKLRLASYSPPRLVGEYSEGFLWKQESASQNGGPDPIISWSNENDNPGFCVPLPEKLGFLRVE
jgi:hypothetical protein